MMMGEKKEIHTRLALMKMKEKKRWPFLIHCQCRQMPVNEIRDQILKAIKSDSLEPNQDLEFSIAERSRVRSL